MLAPNAQLTGNLSFSVSFLPLCQTKLLSDLPREMERNAWNVFGRKQSLFLGRYTVSDQMGNCVVIPKNDIEGSFKLEDEEISASLG